MIHISMTQNTYPGGYRHAIEQREHEKWNAAHYPGTLQLLCEECAEKLLMDA